MNPSRKDRRKAAITLTEALGREVQVHLSLQHAINVPMRVRTEEVTEDEEYDDDELERFIPCSTFAEIECDNKTMSSTIAEGSLATWNESFKFNLK